MKKKVANVQEHLKFVEAEINWLEARILELEQSLNGNTQVQRNHLIRVKNHQEVPDDFIYQGRKFLDLSPEKAWKTYLNKDFDFIIIDVTAADFKQNRIPDAIHIPWDEFPERFLEITNRTTPIIIISEDGTNSILACEFLVKRGYFNCNNISGGYRSWKGSLQQRSNRSA